MVGWWSHKISSRFLMSNQLELDTGANGFRISNPAFMLSVGILGFLQVSGIWKSTRRNKVNPKVFSKTSMEQLRKKSLRLTGYLELLIHHHLSCSPAKENDPMKVSCEVITPRDPQQRGCQLSLKFNCDIKHIYGEFVKRGVAVSQVFYKRSLKTISEPRWTSAIHRVFE